MLALRSSVIKNVGWRVKCSAFGCILKAPILTVLMGKHGREMQVQLVPVRDGTAGAGERAGSSWKHV